MQPMTRTPEDIAYHRAFSTLHAISTNLDRANRNLRANIARSRQQPEARYWKSRIAECRAEIARLEADRIEAKSAMEAALAIVREQDKVAA